MSQPQFQLSSLTKLKFILSLSNFLSSIPPVYKKKKKISNIKCFITFLNCPKILEDNINVSVKVEKFTLAMKTMKTSP